MGQKKVQKDLIWKRKNVLRWFFHCGHSNWFVHTFQTYRRDSASMRYLQEIIHPQRALRQPLHVAYRYIGMSKNSISIRISNSLYHCRLKCNGRVIGIFHGINWTFFVALFLKFYQVKRLINALSVAKNTQGKSIWPITCVPTQMTHRSVAKFVANASPGKNILPTTSYGKPPSYIHIYIIHNNTKSKNYGISHVSWEILLLFNLRSQWDSWSTKFQLLTKSLRLTWAFPYAWENSHIGLEEWFFLSKLSVSLLRNLGTLVRHHIVAIFVRRLSRVKSTFWITCVNIQMNHHIDAPIGKSIWTLFQFNFLLHNETTYESAENILWFY